MSGHVLQRYFALRCVFVVLHRGFPWNVKHYPMNFSITWVNSFYSRAMEQSLLDIVSRIEILQNQESPQDSFIIGKIWHTFLSHYLTCFHCVLLTLWLIKSTQWRSCLWSSFVMIELKSKTVLTFVEKIRVRRDSLGNMPIFLETFSLSHNRI